MHLIVPLDITALAARISYGKRSVLMMQSRKHKIAQSHLVRRRSDCDARNGIEIAHVIDSVVGHSVLSDKSGAIDAEHHRQRRYRHIMDYLVVGTLQKRRVYRHKRTHARFGETAGKRHGMPLRYPHVKRALRIDSLKLAYRCARRHGGGDAHYPAVGLGKLNQCLSEHILIFRRTRSLASEQLSGHRVEAAGSVPHGGVGLCRGVTFTLDSAKMQQFGPFYIFDVVEHPHYAAYVMTVKRPEITYVEPFEYILLLGYKRLQRIIEAKYRTAAALAHQTHLAQGVIHLVTERVVGRRRSEMCQI